MGKDMEILFNSKSTDHGSVVNTFDMNHYFFVIPGFQQKFKKKKHYTEATCPDYHFQSSFQGERTLSTKVCGPRSASKSH